MSVHRDAKTQQRSLPSDHYTSIAHVVILFSCKHFYYISEAASEALSLSSSLGGLASS